ncbi:DUF3144 domain-containing protein [Chitinimonas sp. BJYL2]|uniref:DUF3144 domain-containing protein n=1 Tax=Chitinimonas sp. BJYL2 TaxID=2976696 RepID=UPI0022B58138|nr:DUF3144 domain-containing protein [Chitinimonas sp. BJYL2]
MSDNEDAFFDRADAYVQLANVQLDTAGADEVQAAFLFALTRYTVWTAAQGFDSVDALRAKRGELLALYTAQFQNALKDSLADYIDNFDEYREDADQA